MIHDSKIIRDPVHGDIHIKNADVELLDTPAMQAMRGVRQLGAAYHVYPGAHHTRFEHMLGTYHMAGKLVDRIRINHKRDPKSCRNIASKEETIIRVVGLLHDITHIPHGHAIEDQDGLFPRHDKASVLEQAVSAGELGRILSRRRIRKTVASHLTDAGDVPVPFLSQVVNGHVGADILDYLRRDSYFTGLKIDYDDRLLDFVKVEPSSGRVYIDLVKHNMDREDVLTEVFNLLHCRYVCSERIYYHHAKVASGALISRAVELAIERGLTRDQVAGTQEGEFLNVVAGSAGAGTEAGPAALIERYRNRRLLKRCFVVDRKGHKDIQDLLVKTLAGDPHQRRKIELEISRALGLDSAHEVIVYCPNKKMQLKEAGVLVRRAKRKIRPLKDYASDFPALDQLVEAYKNLWKVYVYVPFSDKDKLAWAGKRVEKVMRTRFANIQNQYKA